MAPELIVWDFDGVLNRNIVDGRFIWADNLETDFGLSLDSLQAHFFASGRIRQIVRGTEDLRDVAAEWLARHDTDVTPDAFLAYWFARDAHRDDQVVALLDAHPGRHVIGTNNDARRARYIENEMGFGPLVERVFASGRMGVAKPEAAFFEAITDWSGVSPSTTLLIDDHAPNCEAARALGWHVFHFTDATRHRLAEMLS